MFLTSGFNTAAIIKPLIPFHGAQASLGADPITFFVTPSVQCQVLQSISCRNVRVSFIPDAVARTDFAQTYPKLAEIDIIDSLSGTVVKKNKFSYEYLGQTSTNPALLNG